MFRALTLALLSAFLISSALPQAAVSGSASVSATPATPVTISFLPNSAVVSTNQTQNFTITLANDNANLGANIVLTGGGCSGPTCGTLSTSFLRNGQAVIYTAPASTPTPNNVTLTATSVQDQTKFTSVLITISGPPPPPTVVYSVCTPPLQTAAATNTFSCNPSQGTGVVIAVIGSTDDLVTGAQACTPANVCTNLTPACPTAGPCVNITANGGLAAHFFGLNLPTGITTYKITNNPVSSGIQIVVHDVSNIIAFDSATFTGSSTTPTTNPTGSVTTTAGGLIVASITSGNVSAIDPPFTLNPDLVGLNVGATAYTLTSTAGTYAPRWTQSSSASALVTSAYVTGPVSTVISVAVNPNSASVQVNTTKQFTATVSNDSQGVNWTLSGAGCSGATCGTLSSGSTASGAPMTYTAPASIPSPATVTLTAQSITDNTKQATATITITAAPVVGVTVNPTSASVVANGTQNITATVTNSGSGVNWTATGAGCTGAACGTVSPTTSNSGVAVTYTAPASVPSPATVTVRATSISDGTKSATTTVTITAPTVTVSINPTTATLTAGGSTQQFTPTVVNSAQGVGWTLSGTSCSGAGCGTLSATTSNSGVPVTYTSPATGTALTITLTATSIQDATKTATASINVNPTSGGGSFHCTPPNCPAFPTAGGGGAVSTGGRGGVVIEVNNLQDSGSGSFRSAVTASGCRYIVFRVSGIIPTLSELQTNNPCFTVLGQTAPGQIILGGPNAALDALRMSPPGTNGSNIVIQYITLSPDNRNVLSGPQGGTSGAVLINCSAINNVRGTGGCGPVIFDHITVRWAGNKSFAVFSNFTPQAPDCQSACNGPNHQITYQWSLMYEPHVGHPVGIGNGTDESGTGSVSQLAFETDQDWHHNLFVNIDHRIPEGPMIRNRWVNNIVFNWSWFSIASLGTDHFDIINNRWKAGNLNSAGPAQPFPILISDCSAQSAIDCSTVPSVYLSGNIGVGATTPAADQYTLANKVVSENGDGVGPIPSNWRRATPISNVLPFPIQVDPATNLDSILLPTVGNSQHVDCNGNWVSHRDQSDSRIISQYQTNGSGGFWPNASYPPIANQTSPNQIPVPTSQWTDVPVTGFPVCTETLHDGIPDQWKTRFGLSTTDPNLYKTIDPAVGLPYIEVYAAGMTP
jgi:hypothetical protein